MDALRSVRDLANSADEARKTLGMRLPLSCKKRLGFPVELFRHILGADALGYGKQRHKIVGVHAAPAEIKITLSQMIRKCQEHPVAFLLPVNAVERLKSQNIGVQHAKMAVLPVLFYDFH